MEKPFKRKQPQQNDIPVLSTADLKKNRANDSYRNKKKVADPMFDFIALAIKFLPLICLFAGIFLIYYYLFSPHKNLQTLAGACVNILIYVAGIVTSAINDAQKHKDDQ
jgi:hypothetical protein